MSITHTFRAPSRRGLLLGMTGLAVGSQVLGMPFISRGLANTPIKIGVGALPANAVGGAGARFVRFGAADALHQVKGKVLGQAVQLVPFDEADVAATQAAFKTLIGEHKVAGIIGGASDETALELLKLAGEAKIPLVIHTAQTDEITGKGCNRWTYRVPIPLGAQFRAIKPYLATYGKKWFTMTGSYGVGKQILALSRQVKAEIGATEVGHAEIDFGITDFGPVIEQIKQLKPDAIISGLRGTDITRFLKAWHAAGMKEKIPFAQVGMADADVWDAGAEAATGIYTKTYHYNNPKNPPEDVEFVKDYAKEFNGAMPGTRAFQSHMAMEALLASIEKAGAPTADKIRAALDQFSTPFGDIKLGFRASDHQMMHRVPILETKNVIKDKFDFWDVETYYPEKAEDLAKFYDAAGAGACSLPSV